MRSDLFPSPLCKLSSSKSRCWHFQGWFCTKARQSVGTHLILRLAFCQITGQPRAFHFQALKKVMPPFYLKGEQEPFYSYSGSGVCEDKNRFKQLLIRAEQTVCACSADLSLALKERFCFFSSLHTPCADFFLVHVHSSEL